MVDVVVSIVATAGTGMAMLCLGIPSLLIFVSAAGTLIIAPLFYGLAKPEQRERK